MSCVVLLLLMVCAMVMAQGEPIFLDSVNDFGVGNGFEEFSHQDISFSPCLSIKIPGESTDPVTKQTQMTFRKADGSYTMYLVGLGEDDGQPEYEISINGNLVKKITLPLGSKRYDEDPKFTNVLVGKVDLKDGDTILVKATTNNRAHARWDGLRLEPGMMMVKCKLGSIGCLCMEELKCEPGLQCDGDTCIPPFYCKDGAHGCPCLNDQPEPCTPFNELECLKSVNVCWPRDVKLDGSGGSSGSSGGNDANVVSGGQCELDFKCKCGPNFTCKSGLTCARDIPGGGRCIVGMGDSGTCTPGDVGCSCAGDGKCTASTCVDLGSEKRCAIVNGPTGNHADAVPTPTVAFLVILALFSALLW